jgi:hypothetical protein
MKKAQAFLSATFAGALFFAATGISPLRAAQRGDGGAFTVGTATAERGKRATGVVHVPSGVDAGYDIPVTVIHGARPGPVLAVVSGAHGTEYASIIAVAMLMADRRRSICRALGHAFLVPVVNIASFERHTASRSTQEHEPLLPGSATVQTDRTSFAMTKEVVGHCVTDRSSGGDRTKTCGHPFGP